MGLLLVHLLLVLDLGQGLLEPSLAWDLDLCLVQTLELDFRLHRMGASFLGLGPLSLLLQGVLSRHCLGRLTGGRGRETLAYHRSGAARKTTNC